MAVVIVLEFSDDEISNELTLEHVLAQLQNTPLLATPAAAHVAGRDAADRVLAVFDGAGVVAGGS